MDPTVIRSTEQTHFEVMAQYIHHKNSSDELSLKVKYWKRKLGEMRIGYPAEFSLSELEATRLRDAINVALAVVDRPDEGELLVLEIGSQRIIAESGDVATVSRSVAAALSDPSVLAALRKDEEGRALVGAMQLSARIAELAEAVEELRSALNSGEVREQFYQDWCDAHNWAFGDAYAMRDDVRTIALGDQVDLLMARTANGLRDIFELKRPDMRLLGYDSSHKCYYWSADASRAIGQCHRYIDALHDYARNGLRDNPDVVAYHPQAFIIQGRSHEWDEGQLRALHGLNARLHGVQLMTYDQLLARATKMIEHLTAEVDR
jgi:antiviral defense system Shedu protein SduA